MDTQLYLTTHKVMDISLQQALLGIRKIKFQNNSLLNHVQKTSTLKSIFSITICQLADIVEVDNVLVTRLLLLGA